MKKTVRPKYFSGYNMSIAQLFGCGPKYHITCGYCNVSFSQRIPLVSNPGCKCSSCGTVNVLPLVVS